MGGVHFFRGDITRLSAYIKQHDPNGRLTRAALKRQKEEVEKKLKEMEDQKRTSDTSQIMKGQTMKVDTSSQPNLSHSTLSEIHADAPNVGPPSFLQPGISPSYFGHPSLLHSNLGQSYFGQPNQPSFHQFNIGSSGFIQPGMDSYYFSQPGHVQANFDQPSLGQPSIWYSNQPNFYQFNPGQPNLLSQYNFNQPNSGSVNTPQNIDWDNFNLNQEFPEINWEEFGGF